MTYNRDLQEDKEPLFDSIDTIRDALDVFGEMIAAMEVRDSVTLEAASDPFLLATDLADYLVLKGVPFRQAHEVIGLLTAYSLKNDIAFQDIPIAVYQTFSNAFDEDVYSVLDVPTALKARKGVGAPSPANLRKELNRWNRELGLPGSKKRK